MGVISSSVFDLIDLYKSQDADGQIAPVIEMLSQMTPILDDAMATECNNGTTHQHTIRSGLPAVTWGKLYKGVPQGKSRKTQVEDTTGFVEGLSSIDCRLLKLSGNEAAARLSEAKGYLQSMANEVGSKMFYADSSSDPEEFMGLAPRFNDLSAQNGNQIIDAGGTGSDNTSLWIVGWGDEQCQMLYPKGTQAGVQREDMGKQRVTDGDGNAYWAMEELFSWHVGLAVKDWRYVVRIANIDVSNMKAGSINLFDFLRTAYYRMEQRRIPGGKVAIYCNRDVLEHLDAMGTNSGTTDNYARLKPSEIEGKEVDAYRGIPVRETDALLNTEARVV